MNVIFYFWGNGSYTIPKVMEFGKKSFATKRLFALERFSSIYNKNREFKDAVKNDLLLQ